MCVAWRHLDSPGVLLSVAIKCETYFGILGPTPYSTSCSKTYYQLLLTNHLHYLFPSFITMPLCAANQRFLRGAGDHLLDFPPVTRAKSIPDPSSVGLALPLEVVLRPNTDPQSERPCAGDLPCSTSVVRDVIYDSVQRINLRTCLYPASCFDLGYHNSKPITSYCSPAFSSDHK